MRYCFPLLDRGIPLRRTWARLSGTTGIREPMPSLGESRFGGDAGWLMLL